MYSPPGPAGLPAQAGTLLAGNPTLCEIITRNVLWDYNSMIMFSWIGTLLELAIPNSYMLLLFVSTLSLILTWAFLKKMLNPFIDVALSILGFALESILTLFFRYINLISTWIEKRVTIPIQKFFRHISPLVYSLIFFLVGVLILTVDQKYGRTLFELDETYYFYKLLILGKTYWISIYAIVFGGIFFSIPLMYVVEKFFTWILHFFDHTIRISFVYYR